MRTIQDEINSVRRHIDAHLNEAARYELFGDEPWASMHFKQALEWDRILTELQNF